MAVVIKQQLQHLENFYGDRAIVKVNELITDKAIELLNKYRSSHGLLIPDGLIAATAIVTNTPLLSKNQRDYRFIVGLNLLTYPEKYLYSLSRLFHPKDAQNAIETISAFSRSLEPYC